MKGCAQIHLEHMKPGIASLDILNALQLTVLHVNSKQQLDIMLHCIENARMTRWKMTKKYLARD